MANPGLGHDQPPPSPTATSPPSLRLRTPPLLDLEVSRGATPPLDHMYPLHSEMRPTRSRTAQPYNEAELPVLIPGARANITNPRLLNTADLELVSFIRTLSSLVLTSFYRPALPNPFSKRTILAYPH